MPEPSPQGQLTYSGRRGTAQHGHSRAADGWISPQAQALLSDPDRLFANKDGCLAALAALAAQEPTGPGPRAPSVVPLPAHAVSGWTSLLGALTHHCLAPPGCARDPGGLGSPRLSRSSSTLPLADLLSISRQLLRLNVKEPQPTRPRGPGEVGVEVSRQADTTAGVLLSPAAAQVPARVSPSRGVRDAAPGRPSPGWVPQLLDAMADAAARCLEAEEAGAQPGDGEEQRGASLLLGVEGGIPHATRASSIAGTAADASGAGGGASASAAVAAADVASSGVQLVVNLVKLGCHGGAGASRLAAALAATCGRHNLVPLLGAKSLQDLVWALGKLHPGVHSLAPVRQLLAAVTVRLAEPGLLAGMAPVGLSMLVYGLGKVGTPVGDTAVWRAVLGAVACAAVRRDCPPQALANMAWGLSRTRPQQQASPRAATPAPQPTPSSPRLAVLPPGSPAPSATVTAGRTAPSRPFPSLVPPPAAAAAISRNATEPNPSSPAAVVVRGSESTGPSSLVAERATYAALAEAAEAQLERFSPRELANLLGALAGLGAWADPRVVQLLTRSLAYMSSRLHELDAMDVAEVLYACATAAEAEAAGNREALRSGSSQPQASGGGAGRGGSGSGVGAYSAPSLAQSQRGPVAASHAPSARPPFEADRELCGLLEGRCVLLLPRCPAYQLATMLWAFTHLGHRPARLLAAVVSALSSEAAVLEGKLDSPRTLWRARPQQAGPSAGHGARSPREDGADQQRALSQGGARRSHPHQHRAPERGQQQGRREPPPPQRQLGHEGEHCREGPGPAWVSELGDGERLPAVQLARLVWALGRLGADPGPGGLRRLCGVLEARLAELDTQSLLMVTWGLAAMRCPAELAPEPLPARLAALLPSLDPDQLPMALWSAARLMDPAGGGAPPPMAWLHLLQAGRGPLARKLPHLGPQGLAMAAWAYAAAGLQPGEAALVALWERAAVLAASPATGPQALAMVAGAMAEFRCRHEGLTRAVLGAAAARMAATVAGARQAAMAAGDPAARAGVAAAAAGGRAAAVWLSSTVCSLGRLRVWDPRLLDLACHHAVLVAPALTAREAVPLLWGVGAMCRASTRRQAEGNPAAEGLRSQAHAGDRWGCPPVVVARLMAVVEQAIRDDAAEVFATGGSAGGASNRTGADARGGSRHGGSQAGPQRPRPRLDGGLLSMFLISCVNHRYRPSPAGLQAACALLRPHVPTLASHTLCDVAWALAMLLPPLGGDTGAHVVLPFQPHRQPGPSGSQPSQLQAGLAATGSAVAPDTPPEPPPPWMDTDRASQDLQRQRQDGGSVDRQPFDGPDGATWAALGAEVQRLYRRAHEGKTRWLLRRSRVLRRAASQEAEDAGPRSLTATEAEAGASGVAGRKAEMGRAGVRLRLRAAGADGSPALGETTAPTSAGVAPQPRASRLLHLPGPQRHTVMPWALRLVGRRPGTQATAAPAPAPAPAEAATTTAAPTRASAGRGTVAGSGSGKSGAAGVQDPAAAAGITGPGGAQRSNGRAAGKAPGRGAALTGKPTAATAAGTAGSPPVSQATPMPGSATGPDHAQEAKQTPQASRAAPIYPPREAVPPEQAASHLVLARLLAHLRWRLCVDRAEVLTMEPLVRVTWAMSYLRMYTPK